MAFSGFGSSWLWRGLGFIGAKAKAKLSSLPKALAQAKPSQSQAKAKNLAVAWLEILRGQGQAKKPKPKPEHHWPYGNQRYQMLPDLGTQLRGATSRYGATSVRYRGYRPYENLACRDVVKSFFLM